MACCSQGHSHFSSLVELGKGKPGIRVLLSEASMGFCRSSLSGGCQDPGTALLPGVRIPANSSGHPGVQAVSWVGLVLYKLLGPQDVPDKCKPTPYPATGRVRAFAVFLAACASGTWHLGCPWERRQARPGWICLHLSPALIWPFGCEAGWGPMQVFALFQRLLNRREDGWTFSSERGGSGWGGASPGNHGEGGRTYSGQEPETRTHYATQAWWANLISIPCLHVFLPQHGCSKQRWMSR